ncbi:MBL fold metallo-hydrolase RNA specificity domain-containing protein, partial [Ruminococcus bicirculans (ex Wegman et al. 2014)]
KNKNSCFDEEAMSYVNKGINPIIFSGLNIAVTSDESRAINFIDTPKIIISASGMCEAGRIKHHLKHNLWKPENTILFVGYQAMNTLGRSLVDGAKTAKLFGEEVVVRAEILVLPGVSGHADVDGLDKWIKSYEMPPKKVFVNHGEDSVTEAYKDHLRNDFGLNAFAPYSGAELDLISGEFKNTTPIKIVKKTGASPNYQRLLSALDRLTALVNKSSGLTNKDLAKLTDTINNICAKWND